MTTLKAPFWFTGNFVLTTMVTGFLGPANGLSAGRGWIAVALVIFAFWRPWRAVAGSLLFGGVMAFQLRLQAMGAALPSSLLLMLPYLMTILALCLAAWRNLRHGRARRFGRVHDAPAMLGVNLEPED